MGRAGIVWAAASSYCVVRLPVGPQPCRVKQRKGRTVPGDRGAAWTCFWPYRATCRTVAYAPHRPCWHGAVCSRDHRCWRSANCSNNQFCKIHHLHTQPSISPARAQGLRRHGDAGGNALRDLRPRLFWLARTGRTGRVSWSAEHKGASDPLDLVSRPRSAVTRKQEGSALPAVHHGISHSHFGGELYRLRAGKVRARRLYVSALKVPSPHLLSPSALLLMLFALLHSRLPPPWC